MSTRGSTTDRALLVAILVVLGVLGVVGNVMFVRWAAGGSTPPAVQEAQDSIATLLDALSERQDTLDALRAAQSVARSASDSVSAEVDESQAEDAEVVQEEEATIDSLAAVIDELVDDSTAVARAVVQLVASHDSAMLRSARSLEAERRRSRALLFRAETAEALVIEHEARDVVQEAIIATHAQLDRERERQVAKLTWERNGAIAGALAALGCMAFCG